MTERGQNGSGNGGAPGRVRGYGLGKVDTVISVEDVAREAEKIAANAPKPDELAALAGEDPYLSIENLRAGYGKMQILHDFNLKVGRGQSLCLIGPNGAGKTTTFYMITGMIRPSSGKIIFGDEDITKSPMYKRARMGIGYLAQEPSIFGKLSVEDNLKIVLETIISNKEEQNQLIDKLLNEFNISHIRNNIGAGLSGGERRRVEICRTLALKPDFVLLDEPFAGVDPIAVEDIQQMIISLKQQNIGVLITDHNVRETLSITDRSYLLYGGKILKSGDAQTLANDEEVRRIYLGKNFKLDQ